MSNKSILCVLLSLIMVFLTMTTGTFAQTDLSDEGYPILNETERALADRVMGLELSVRTVKTPNKNIKVMVNTNTQLQQLVNDAEAAGYKIYYKYCRSVKKSSKYITRRTIPDKTYINTEGVKGKKYYYKVRVLLFDRIEGSFVSLAESELRQCRYGVRTWTK